MANARERLDYLRSLEAADNQEVAEPVVAASPKRERLDKLKAIEKSEGDIHGMGVTESIASIGSSILAEPVAGIAGIAQALNPFADEGAGAEAVEKTRDFLTYKPETQFGKDKLSDVGEVVAPVAEKFTQLETALGDYAFEMTGSPTLGAAATASPTALLEILGLGSLKKLKAGTELIDDMGRPTIQLEKALDKHGLTYDNLLPEVRAEIPDIAEGTLMPRADSSKAAGQAEKTLIEQIKAGGRDDALAGLKVVDNKVVPDDLGVAAIKQGFDSGFIQAIKTASPSTRQGLLKMTNIMQRISKNKSVAMDIRPTDIVGDAVSSRIKYIRDKANTARADLNEIANKSLKGRDIDAAPVIKQLQDSLDSIDVDLVGEGIPKPKFEGSMISKDRTSQKVIKDLIDLMSEGGKPDALRFHKLKRQIDTLINFKKKSAGGLTDAGRNVLKDIRSSLNKSLRNISPDYADVNDVLSSSLNALDEFQSISGSSIDIFGRGSEKAIGQDMRGLMSNRKSRVRLENALSQVEEVASGLGGKFDDNIKDLSLFANQLENRFGAVADSSFKGEIASAFEQGFQKSASQALKDKAFQKAAEKANKLKGINDFNAFKAMRDLATKE